MSGRSFRRTSGAWRALWPCCLLLLAACGGATPTVPGVAPGAPTPTPPTSVTTRGTPPAPFAGIRTVFVIVMENHNWADIAGSPAAPYINGTLLPLASHAERYASPPGVHPSLPNYL